MSDPATTTVEVNGFPCRVWTKGSGPKLGFLAGFGGLPRWVPFLDELAKTRTVIVPSLPGYPGGGLGHTVLDTHIDWVLAVRQIVEKAGLAGADLLGASVGGAFAAEMAAIFPGHVRKLALIAPFSTTTFRVSSPRCSGLSLIIISVFCGLLISLDCSTIWSTT